VTTWSFASKHTGNIGKEGEDMAGRFLRDQGLKILKRNYRTRWGEVDIVARERDTIVFVEVKTRSKEAFGGPLSAVTREKQQRIRRMAEAYFIENGFQDVSARFDVVGIVKKNNGTPRIDWIKNAFGGL